MQPMPLILALCIAPCAALAPPPLLAQDAARHSHFIDFRARPGAMVGHTFILYGRIDQRGRAVETARAGLYPDDGAAGLIFGTLLPVSARVRAVPDDYSETPSAIYRRALTGAEYARLKATVTQLRANDHAWHMLTHNCNDFAAIVAQSLRLVTPPPVLVPNAWVRALKAMNEP